MESTSYSAIGPGPTELTSSAGLYGAAPSWLLAEITQGPGLHRPRPIAVCRCRVGCLGRWQELRRVTLQFLSPDPGLLADALVRGFAAAGLDALIDGLAAVVQP